MTAIPAQIYVEIDPEDIPVGPAGSNGSDGKDNYQLWLDDGHTGSLSDYLQWVREAEQSGVVSSIQFASISPVANTASTVYVSTGLSCQITTEVDEKVDIDVRGMCNHSTQQIVHFTLKRNGVELTPANHTGLACARIDISDGCRALDFQHQDLPGDGTHTYELFWKNTNSGTAYLGRRPADTIMMVPTTMKLTAHK